MWVKYGTDRWLDTQQDQSDYEVVRRIGDFLYTAHINPESDQAYNGSAIHVYRIGAAHSAEWPLDGAKHLRSVQIPEFEGASPDNLTPLWERLAREAEAEDKEV